MRPKTFLPFVLSCVLVILAAGSVQAASVKPLSANTHLVGGIDHGMVVANDAHAFTEHAHSGKNVTLKRKLANGSQTSACYASGTAAHIHCAGSLGGVYTPAHHGGAEGMGGYALDACGPTDDMAVASLPDGHGMCPHSGSAQLLRGLDHVPAASLVAGDAVTLAVTASAACTSPCTSETGTLKYTAADGTWKTLAPTSTTSTGYTFNVPGDAVRWPSLKYYFDFNRCTSAGCSALRLPSEANFEALVQNTLNLGAVLEDGSPLQVSWKLEVIGMGSTDTTSNQQEVTSGITGTDGLVSMTLPYSSAVTAAASSNRGMANFLLTSLSKNDSNMEAWSGAFAFSANFGNPDSRPGLKLGPSERVHWIPGSNGIPIPSMQMNQKIPCPEGDLETSASGCTIKVPDEVHCYAKNISDGGQGPAGGWMHYHDKHAHKLGKLFDVSYGYGLETTVRIGEENFHENFVSVAIKAGTGKWVAADAGVEVSSGTSATTSSGVPFTETFRAKYAPAGTIQTYYDMRHTQQWHWYAEPQSSFGKCMLRQETYPSAWNPYGVEAAISLTDFSDGSTYDSSDNHKKSDCADTCATEETLFHVTDTLGWEKVAGQAVSKSESFCVFICVGNQSSFQKYQQIAFHKGTGCLNGWYLYPGAGGSLVETSRVWVDSGQKGSAVVGSKPAGC